LAPQKDTPSAEIKSAVESATGADKGDGVNPSDEIKAAVKKPAREGPERGVWLAARRWAAA